MITKELAVGRMMEMAVFIRDEFPGFDILVELVGSCAIQGQGNDVDVMVYVKERGIADDVGAVLLAKNWTEQEGKSDEYGVGEFRSFRSYEVNVLLVWDIVTYIGWLASVEVCKYIGTTTREQRVAIHQIIMDGELAGNLSPYLGSL